MDGTVHGRPSWSESVVITVAGRGRPVRFGGFDVHALIARLQEWVGDAVPASEGTASPS
ncbi:hypothetical protein [Cellulosimicrobium cellulans]|uniref:hypothetical protein n=1 Tax=Cellulosimicrobium cellulans TaxID=1710 RepID=UPI0016528DEC|nr:hypothetical protein [Cellulosimicrobium cellulans]